MPASTLAKNSSATVASTAVSSTAAPNTSTDVSILDRTVRLASNTVGAATSGLKSWVTPSTSNPSTNTAPLAVEVKDMTVDEANNSVKVKAILAKATSMLGTPYRWGGTTPNGFDCSGLVGWVFRNALGVELPRVSRDMARQGTSIKDRAEMVAGDLVFFGTPGRISHVGIYIGEGRFLHAPRTGRDVTISTLSTGYWAHKFVTARRVDGL